MSRSASPRPVGRRRSTTAMVVLFAALALVAPACSSDDPADTTVAPGVDTTAAPGVETTTAEPGPAETTTETGPAVTDPAETTPLDTSVTVEPTDVVADFPLPEEGTFRMGIEPWLGYGGWIVADKQGLFNNNGLNVTLTNVATADEMKAALVAGTVDGANLATHTALRLKSEGAPITIVTLLGQSNEADAIIAKKTITSIADLKGKKVAYEPGTTSDLLLHAALAENGMTLADITPVKLLASAVPTALQSGQADAGVTYEPYITPFLQRSSDFASLYPASRIPGIISDVFVVRDDVLASRPGQVHGLLVSLGEAIDSYNANTNAAQAIISTGVGAKPGDLVLAFRGVHFLTTMEAKSMLTGEFATKTMPAIVKAATDAGIITKPVDAGALIDTTRLVAVG